MNTPLKEIMDKKTITLLSKNIVKEAVFLLVKYDLRFLPVVNENNVVIGAFSESDLMNLVKIHPTSALSSDSSTTKKDIGQLKIAEVMAPRPVIIDENSTVSDALNMMHATNLKVLIVTDKDKKFVGVVRFRDLIERLLEKV